MSLIIVKFINMALMNFVAILITKNITKSQVKLFTFKNFLLFLLSLLPTALFYTTEYDFTTFITYLLLILCTKNIFHIDILTSFIINLYVMVVAAVFDLIVAGLIVNFFSLNQIRTNCLIIFITNLIVSSCTLICFFVPIVRKIVNESLERLQKPKNRKVIIFCLFGYIVIVITFYLASKSFVPTKNYFIINILILTFIAMIFIYMNEIIKYDKLVIQNNILYECMQNVENYKEQQDLKIHEYRNQLSKVMDITNDQKVIDELSEILKK